MGVGTVQEGSRLQGGVVETEEAITNRGIA